MHLKLQGAVARCFCGITPASDAATQTDLGEGGCRLRTCVAQKQKLKSQVADAVSQVSTLSQKMRTADAKAAREWRGMLNDSQAMTAEAVTRLREAQWERNARNSRNVELEKELEKLRVQLAEGQGHLIGI